MNGVTISQLDILVPWQKVEEYMAQNLSGLYTVNAMTTRTNKQVKNIEIQDPNSGIKCKMWFMMNDHGMLKMEPVIFTGQNYIEDPNESIVDMFENLAQSCGGTFSWAIDDQPFMVENGRTTTAEFCVVKRGTNSPKNVDGGPGTDDDDSVSYEYYIKDFLDSHPVVQSQMAALAQQSGNQIDGLNHVVVELIKARQTQEISSRCLRDLLDQMYSFGATHPTGKQLYDLLISE